MITNGLPLSASLIIDNCVLSLLCDYCADRATGIGRNQMFPHMIEWLSGQLSNLRSFTPDGMIHSSIAVSDELGGYTGKLSEELNQSHTDCQRFVDAIKDEINSVAVSDEDIAIIRGLPAFPVKYFSKNQLGDADISLAVLALKLAAGSDRVFILTNDQQLLRFMSWLKTKREARENWGDPRQVEGIHSLTYLENIHRHCTISTEEMEQILQYAFKAHYSKEILVATNKGSYILNSLLAVQSSLIESVKIKVSGGDA